MSIWEYSPEHAQYRYFEGFPFFRQGSDIHRDIAVYFLTEGEFEYRIGNSEPKTVCSGEAVICPSDTIFSKKVIKTVTMHLINITLNTTEPVPYGCISFEKEPRITDTLERLKGLLSQDAIPASAYREHLIADLWYSLLCLSTSPFVTYTPAVNDPFFCEIITYIDRHLSTSLSELANAFHCSRLTISKRFKSLSGKSVGEFVTEKRIATACEMIEQTDAPFKAIAERCGFSSEYYFHSVFKKYTGYPPGKWRRLRSKA